MYSLKFFKRLMSGGVYITPIIAFFIDVLNFNKNGFKTSSINIFRLCILINLCLL